LVHHALHSLVLYTGFEHEVDVSVCSQANEVVDMHKVKPKILLNSKPKVLFEKLKANASMHIFNIYAGFNK